MKLTLQLKDERKGNNNNNIYIYIEHDLETLLS